MMDPDVKRLTIPAVLESIEAACEFVANVAREIGMGDDAVYHCYLSVEEICTNVIEHGYHYKGQNEVIDIVCRRQPQGLEISIIDDAAHFNPLALADPDPTAPLMSREGGGWGVFFVKKYMDRIDYHFEQNRNRFIMEKYYS